MEREGRKRYYCLYVRKKKTSVREIQIFQVNNIKKGVLVTENIAHIDCIHKYHN